MKKILFASVLAGSLVASVGAQAKFGFNYFPPFPNYIVKINTLGGTVDGSEIISVVSNKLSNNADGEWTMSLTVRSLDAAWGGDGSSTGVLMGTFSPYTLQFTPNTQAAALNSGGNDLHISLSPDGRWAVIARPSGCRSVLRSWSRVRRPRRCPRSRCTRTSATWTVSPVCSTRMATT